jgi:hypothetical protein
MVYCLLATFVISAALIYVLMVTGNSIDLSSQTAW